MIKFYKYFYIIIFILICFSSCKTKKNITKEQVKDTIAQPVIIKEDYSKNKFDSLKNNEFEFSFLSLKFEAKANLEKSENNLNGQIRIKKDSVIWASITPGFGIELFRILITRDSIKMLNKMNNTYFAGDYKLINSLFNIAVDFDMLQGFITGNDFFNYNNLFKLTTDSATYKLSTTNRQKINSNDLNNNSGKTYSHDIWLDNKTFKIVKQTIKDNDNVNNILDIEYSDFIKEKNFKLFPQCVNINVTSEKKININIKYLKMEVDKEQKFPFNVPDKFTRVK